MQMIITSSDKKAYFVYAGIQSLPLMWSILELSQCWMAKQQKKI